MIARVNPLSTSSRAVGVFLILACLAGTPSGSALAQVADKTRAATKPKPARAPSVPRQDPPDVPFRRAPMSAATRSVHIPLATNLHVAFDTELLRTHVVWEGRTLDLWGAVYHAGKEKFYCDFDGRTLWTMPPVFPWAVGKLPDVPAAQAPSGARFVGLDTKGARTALLYDLPLSEGSTVRVRETPMPGELPGSVVREFEFQRGAGKLWLLVAALPESKRLALPKNNPLLFKTQTVNLDLTQRIWRENKNDSEIVPTPVRGRFQLAWLQLQPQGNAPLRIGVETRADGDEVHVGLTRLSPPATGAAARPVKIVAGERGFQLPGGDAHYRLERFPLPKEAELLVTGMDFLPNGDLAVCTWLGEVWIVQQATGAPSAATYRRFARGLCEPGGLKVIEGDIYVVQKQELTRLRDTDGNGEADLFECLNQDWGFTGNYHDFSFGPTLDREGNFHVFRNGNRGLYEVPLMGWDIVVSRDGRTVTPFCAGLRSPNGFGAFQGDIFMTENQGNWMGACKLNHLQKGRFYGYPSTSPAPRDEWFDHPTKFDPPAVWFPYKLAKSASGFAVIEDDRFGPFKGQMLVGEFQNAIVTRVFLEKVNGEWQGCVWPFAKGFGSGVNRLSFGPDGKLYVGGCKNAAWAAVAPKDCSLDRVSFTGKVPFEIREVRALTDGFDLVFTAPVDPAAAGRTDNWDVTQYTYAYHQKYGSPEFDFDGKPDSASEIKVVRATVSPDRLKVRLQLDGWRAGYVAAIRALEVVSAEGQPLRHDTCHYTLNQIPR
jgi:glucose/arabinose dehydrogenase